ncbi:M14 family metallopeptidase [Chitinophaga pinensis]|uniref:Peptidase M14 carboxypeptidase A n=1 Tax=Chitinophaga pinensis (strain ATCC 43595 / DSM 2588 / LMG 13176 / NBRC 15968 / NCIMB 11800 / UQM 2034) TaxID=485918 RepID=A0A979G9W6_CHIPD|nr:M14 family metallopeptidase [Chitinophaga pinensis]ACU63342.1 peptidase M14 carboxypeptidase A [Chitinophaga pinensis DSM 2588]
MRKLLLSSLLLLFVQMGFSQTLPTPDQFLGYALGTQFTPYHRVLDYFKAVAAVTPNMQFTQYGTTYEGRPLMLAVISAPENMAKTEEIRQHNLDLSFGTGKPAASDPVIVWLSYNVHGNEAVSTEAAMSTLYLLANKANTETQEWLKKVVVLIDPCLNPDGRERYVNFYNQVHTRYADPLLFAREHNEPWPGGRANHYYFDLNRDWAWQTQRESQQRVAQYSRWMPQVHVDFHEQSIDAPYYFAPAAEPFHDIIKPWQRSMQMLIGKNNARYFDKEGWLYFTKEFFDMFYPSYGDTYPTYNGAIGMTYEQGGGGRAGLAGLKQDGDTLTLSQRIAHHRTTGLSTIEIASQQSSQLLNEYSRYFYEAVHTPEGPYQSYVIKAAGNNEKLASLGVLLNRNGIRFGYGAGVAKAIGFNYFNGKTESFTIDKEDMVISAAQARSNLLKVLFEPDSRLTDSVTYDITAWSLPYAYGLQTYALRQSLTPAKDSLQVTVNTALAAVRPYAYLARWNSIKDVRFLSALLQKKIRVRYAEGAFMAGGKNFPAGTLIITRSGNEAANGQFDEQVVLLADTYKTTLDAVTTGFVEKGVDFGSEKVRFIKPVRIAVAMGEGVSSLAAGEVWHFFEQQINYPLTVVDVKQLPNVNWKALDVLILPDGNYRYLADKDFANKLRDWVTGGGKLIVMQDALAQIAGLDWGIHQKKLEEEKDEKKDEYALLKSYANREREGVKQLIPGAIYKVQLDNTHPLAFGFPSVYYTLKQDSRIYEYLEEGGWNVGIIKKDNYLSGFVGTEMRKKLKDGLIFGVKEMGEGKIVLMADDPLFRSFWENGKLLFGNALFMVW